jgi:hypothetical protein
MKPDPPVTKTFKGYLQNFQKAPPLTPLRVRV